MACLNLVLGRCQEKRRLLGRHDCARRSGDDVRVVARGLCHGSPTGGAREPRNADEKWLELAAWDDGPTGRTPRSLPPRPVSPPRCMRAVCLSFFIIMAISMRHHRFAYDVSGVGGGPACTMIHIPARPSQRSLIDGLMPLKCTSRSTI